MPPLFSKSGGVIAPLPPPLLPLCISIDVLMCDQCIASYHMQASHEVYYMNYTYYVQICQNNTEN